MIKHVFEIYGKYSNVFGNIRKSLEMFGRCSAIFRKFGKFLEVHRKVIAIFRNSRNLRIFSNVFGKPSRNVQYCSERLLESFGIFLEIFGNDREFEKVDIFS